MNRYYFHLLTPTGRDVDQEGCEFESLEAALESARRAAVDMSAEMMSVRRDPRGCQFQICDDAGEPLMLLPFGDVLSAPPHETHRQFLALRERIELADRNRHRIVGELKAGFSETRQSLNALRATIREIKV